MEELTSKQSWYKGKVSVVIISTVVLATIAGLTWFKLVQTKPSLPPDLKDQVRFTYFLPHKLPQDYSVQQTSYAYNQGVLIYRVTGPKNVTILVTQQPEPGNFDIGHFQNILKDKLGVETSYGTAYVGKSENIKIGSLVAGGSWLFMSAPPTTDSQILKTILQHIYKLKL